MKAIKLFTLFILFSLQARATGYSHNMFVAHKKLQAVREKCVSTEHVNNKSEKPAMHLKSVGRSFKQQVSHKLSGVVTLNQGTVNRESATFFISDKQEDTQNSLVAKFVGLVKVMMFSFLSSISFS
jgi:hypothetical protein